MRVVPHVGFSRPFSGICNQAMRRRMLADVWEKPDSNLPGKPFFSRIFFRRSSHCCLRGSVAFYRQRCNHAKHLHPATRCPTPSPTPLQHQLPLTNAQVMFQFFRPRVQWRGWGDGRLLVTPVMDIILQVSFFSPFSQPRNPNLSISNISSCRIRRFIL